MNTITTKREQVVKSLEDKEYRDAFVAENISTGIALQIRAMRMARGWSQEELARRAGKKQEVISKLENPDYGSYTLKTLKDLASAFDVALTVEFAPFSELVDRFVNVSREDLEVPSFDHDRALQAALPSFPFSLGDALGNWASTWGSAVGTQFVTSLGTTFITTWLTCRSVPMGVRRADNLRYFPTFEQGTGAEGLEPLGRAANA